MADFFNTIDPKLTVETGRKRPIAAFREGLRNFICRA